MEFDITVMATRSVEDFETTPRDDNLCELHPMMIIGSQNFHWWALHTSTIQLRVEAIRTNDAMRDDGRWAMPYRFRLKRTAGKKVLDEYEIAPKDMFDLRKGGISPHADWILSLMQKPHFRLLTYAVGRRVVIITPEQPELGQVELEDIPESVQIDDILEPQEMVDDDLANRFADSDDWMKAEPVETGE